MLKFFFSIIGAKFLTYFMSLFLVKIILSEYGEFSYGEFVYYYSFLSFVGPVLLHGSRPYSSNILNGNSISLSSGSLITSLLFVMVVIFVILELILLPFGQYNIMLFLLLVLLDSIVLAIGYIFRSKRKDILFIYTLVLPVLLKVVLMCLTASRSIVSIYIYSNVLCLFGLFFIVKGDDYKLVLKKKFVYDYLKSLPKYISVAFIGLIQVLQNKADKIMLGLFSSTILVGIINIFGSIAGIFNFILLGTNSFFSPIYSNFMGQKKNIDVLVSNQNLLLYHLNFVALVFLLVGYPFILMAFDLKQDGYYFIFYIILVAQFINSSLGANILLVNLIGRSSRLLKVLIPVSLASMGLMYLGVKHYGGIGAAITVLLYTIIYNLFSYYLLRGVISLREVLVKHGGEKFIFFLVGSMATYLINNSEILILLVLSVVSLIVVVSISAYRSVVYFKFLQHEV